MKNIRNRRFLDSVVFNATESNYAHPLTALRSGAEDVCINKQVAQEWLMFQENIVFQATVYWLQIKHIGLGLYAVRRRARGKQGTFLVETFENE
jgi:hypothetical protein